MNNVLRIPSITGIDLDLEIAGPGARSYAFVIDWHIRVLIALAWVVAGMVFFAMPWIRPAVQERTVAILLFVPAVAIYLLYHPVIEVLFHGRTPGKRIAGVRLVGRDGGTPSVGSLLIRNVFRLVDCLPVFYAVGLATTFLNQESLRIGDFAAGTVLVYDVPKAEPSMPSLPSQGVEHFGLKQAEVVRELLGRWSELTPSVRQSLARQLLTKLGRAPAGGGGEHALHAALQELLA